MPGRVFVAGFLLVMLGFFLLAVLFNFYPPAGNSWLTLAGVALYAALSLWIVRKAARK